MKRLRPGQSGPRAGLAVHRYGPAQRSGRPPRPSVKAPTEWSWPVQQLVERAEHSARESLQEQDVALDNPKRQQESYERACFFIDRDMHNVDHEGNRRASPLERAQARLCVWMNLYEG